MKADIHVERPEHGESTGVTICSSGGGAPFFPQWVIIATWVTRLPAVQARLRLTPGELGLAGALLGGLVAARGIACPGTGGFLCSPG